MNGAAVPSARGPASPRTLWPALPLASHQPTSTSRITPTANAGIVIRMPSIPSSYSMISLTGSSDGPGRSRSHGWTAASCVGGRESRLAMRSGSTSTGVGVAGSIVGVYGGISPVSGSGDGVAGSGSTKCGISMSFTYWSWVTTMPGWSPYCEAMLPGMTSDTTTRSSPDHERRTPLSNLPRSSVVQPTTMMAAARRRVRRLRATSSRRRSIEPTLAERRVAPESGISPNASPGCAHLASAHPIVRLVRMDA